MRFGEELRSERERRGIALDDICVATRVSLRNLSALESERFCELPGGVFNRSIVRSYARFCGMDDDATITAYMDALREQGIRPEVENESWVTFAENVRRNRAVPAGPQRMRWVGIAGMAAAVAVLAVAVLYVLVQRGMVHLPTRVGGAMHLGRHDTKHEIGHEPKQPTAEPNAPETVH